MNKLKKMMLLPVSLTLGLAGCMGIGPHKTYVLTKLRLIMIQVINRIWL